MRLSAPEARRRLASSPVAHLATATADGQPHVVAVTFAVGGDESAEFHRQQTDFVARWRARKRPVDVVDLPGLNHFSVMDEYAGGRLTEVALAQMGLGKR